jgi:hypothetical protein
MSRKAFVRVAVGLVLLLAVAGSNQAGNWAVHTDDEFQFRGQWILNFDNSSAVYVRVQNVTSGHENVRILEKVLAKDGSVLTGWAVGQIRPGHIREFRIPFAKPLAELKFTTILEVKVDR